MDRDTALGDQPTSTSEEPVSAPADGEGNGAAPADPLTVTQVEAAAAGEPEPAGAAPEQTPQTLEPAEAPEAGRAPEAPEPAQTPEAPEPAQTPEAPEPAQTPEAPEPAQTPEAPTALETASAEPAAQGEVTASPEHRAQPGSAAAESRSPDAPARSVGRAIGDALRAAGVRYAFTVPGESFLALLDGLAGAGIHVVTTRHENGAGFMAEAYGQLTGRPAACIATRAVGAANLAIGIHTARQNSTPMIVLVGQVERAFLGREAFQEIDQVESIGRLALWAAEPRTPADAARAVDEAIRRALGARPGPVLLSLPEDLLDEPAPPPVSATNRPALPRPDADDVRAVLQLLASADRPVILAGGGVLRARTSGDLVRLAEQLHVPVMASWRRPDVFPNDHPLYLGMTGYGSPPVVRERLEQADALLVLGARLSEIASFGYAVPREGLRWAHVDLEPRRGTAGLRDADLPVRSDARAFIRAAVQRLRDAALNASRVDARAANAKADRAAWEAATLVDGGDWSGPGIHPGRVVTTLRRVLPDLAIVTTDAGNFGGWIARGYRFRRPGTFLGPTSGAMGYGLPAAIAAAIVHRDRPVVAVTGDGGLAMSMAELETAVRERLRLTVLVFDNQRYGTIRMHQDGRAGEPIGTDLGPVDFAAVARACGGRGVRVDADEAFEPALREALGSDRPTVIQLPLDRRWVSVDQPAVPAG